MSATQKVEKSPSVEGAKKRRDRAKSKHAGQIERRRTVIHVNETSKEEGRNKEAELQTVVSELREMLKEHERRIGAVSDCLSEKAEENIQLYEEKDALQRELQIMKEEKEKLQKEKEVLAKDYKCLEDQKFSILHELDNANSSVEVKERDVADCQRKLEVLGQCMNDAVGENEFLREEIQKLKEQNSSASSQQQQRREQKKSWGLFKSRFQPAEEPKVYSELLQQLAVSETKAGQAQDRADALEKDNRKLNFELQQRQKKEEEFKKEKLDLNEAVAALEESNEEYEIRIQKTQDRLKDSLKKEQKRRKAAEGSVSSLRKKVDELEFLLMEQDDDDDDDDDSDEDEDDSDDD